MRFFFVFNLTPRKRTLKVTETSLLCLLLLSYSLHSHSLTLTLTLCERRLARIKLMSLLGLVTRWRFRCCSEQSVTAAPLDQWVWRKSPPDTHRRCQRSKGEENISFPSFLPLSARAFLQPTSRWQPGTFLYSSRALFSALFRLVRFRTLYFPECVVWRPEVRRCSPRGCFWPRLEAAANPDIRSGEVSGEKPDLMISKQGIKKVWKDIKKKQLGIKSEFENIPNIKQKFKYNNII